MTAALCVVMIVMLGGARAGEPTDLITYTRDLTMPGVSPKMPEAYLCAAFPLNTSVEEWVVKFEPLASAHRAHHMLLYGCAGVPHTSTYCVLTLVSASRGVAFFQATGRKTDHCPQLEGKSTQRKSSLLVCLFRSACSGLPVQVFLTGLSERVVLFTRKPFFHL
ncbi:Copper type II ascorbate-dependent monooxygenase N-terminal [Trinorchestia longiramus]|nr:Copper type II ascorbate-dependent monooxygenase N-terminal [Trinorchestia longiramus]